MLGILLVMTAPVTLSCVLDAKAPMTLRLDEAHGAVRYAFPATARAVTSRALFARDRILFDGFTLDRSTLTITRDGDSVTASLYAQPREARGQCRIDRAHPHRVTPAKAGVSRGRRGT